MRIAVQREREGQDKNSYHYMHTSSLLMFKNDRLVVEPRDALENLHRKAHCVIQDEQADAKAGTSRENGKGSTLLREQDCRRLAAV